MYFAIIILLMGVLPVLSILVELMTAQGADLVFLIGKWFVFWAVGVRLAVAGIRQIANPQFTAEHIFEIEDPKASVVVQELGFGNVSIGLLGILSLYQPAWVVPAAIVGGLFYALAGIKHALRGGRNRTETIAMVSDLFIGILLALYLLATVTRLG